MRDFVEDDDDDESKASEKLAPSANSANFSLSFSCEIVANEFANRWRIVPLEMLS